MPDLDDPATAIAAFLLVLSILIVAIAMDMRRLPIGRIKYVPWTYITITAILALALAGRNMFIVLTQA